MDKVTTLIRSETICPICAETFTFPQNIYEIRHSCCRDCSHDPICYSCCYRHIKSITSDLTSGRRSILCPFTKLKNTEEKDVAGWTDLEIRYIISRHHSMISAILYWDVLKPIIYSAVKKYWEWWVMLPLVLICIVPSWTRLLGFVPIFGNFVKVFKMRSSAEDKSHYLYLALFFIYVCIMWPIAMRRALSFVMFFVSYGRILPNLLLFVRHRNTLNQARIYLVNIFNPRHRDYQQAIKEYERWCVESALANLSIAQGGRIVRCPVPNCENLWIIPIDYRRRKENNEASYFRLVVGPGEDRRMHCSSCNVYFCGLCLRPWSNFYTGKNHSGTSCSRYNRQFESIDGGNDDGYAAVAFSSNARRCPGCSIRIQRSEGCNHMTCPCGMEWCYVCGKNWSNYHYGCRDGQSSSYCTIS